jgi:hypothetical protein
LHKHQKPPLLKIVIVDRVERHRKFAWIALLAYELGLIALLVLLPLLVIPFSGIGAVIIISIEAVLILVIYPESTKT